MICDRCKAEITQAAPHSDKIKIVEDPDGPYGAAGFKVLWGDGSYSQAPNRSFADGLVAQELRRMSRS